MNCAKMSQLKVFSNDVNLSTVDSFSSSLATQPDLLDETTQTKRARFLTESILSTFQESSVNKDLEQKLIKFENMPSSQKSSQNNFFLNDIISCTLNLNGDNFCKNNGEFYGLSSKVQDLLKKFRNISCLYDWQDELLTLMVSKLEKLEYFTKTFNSEDKSINSKCITSLFQTNLLYLSPTSGGKTLVAEMLMLYCLLRLNKNVIFVMPFVSIVQEKVQLMVPFGENLNFHVEEYAGVKGNHI